MRADLSHVIAGEPASGQPWFSEVKNSLSLFFARAKKMRADLSHVITGEPASGQPWSATVCPALKISLFNATICL